ncbi:unnamed protein product [Rotaria sp. Silwood2]|nr:unnamed protein product [Rotaria sp. Silwood2]CAF2805911.1 unnamed protein product [Rotaria sp. Silwood2]CAF3123275.1 unnamed protein product [Rotaria sp. Silwood2]CAF3123506.1 unnamed protein product [Rotaria sp. Silwood2]CAF4212779.1 unnamed protein product [Rotaria sp. Silwood2]
MSSLNNQSLNVNYRYQNIRIVTQMLKQNNQICFIMKNDLINLNEQIDFDINITVEKLDELLHSLANQFIMTLNNGNGQDIENKNINSHHNLLNPSSSMSSYVNPHHLSNLASSYPHIHQIMPSPHSINPNAIFPLLQNNSSFSSNNLPHSSPYMLSSCMQGPDGMIVNTSSLPPPPPCKYLNGPRPHNFLEQFGAGSSDPYGQLPPHYPQDQTERFWKKMKTEHYEDKSEQMYEQQTTGSSSSLISTTASMSESGDLGLYNNPLSSGMKSSTVSRLCNFGKCENFIPDSLSSSSINKALPGNVDDVQLITSSRQINFDKFGEFDMDNEELAITQNLNQTYRPDSEISDDLLSSSFLPYKHDSLTTSKQSISTRNHHSNTLLSERQQSFNSTTSTHHSQQMILQNAPATSPHSSKLITNNNSSLSVMMSNNNLTKDESFNINSDRKSTSNMVPSLSNMFRMTNTLQSSNSSTDQDMNPFNGLPHGRQQIDTRFSTMKSRRYRPYHYPQIHHPSNQMHLNDGQPLPAPTQSINNTPVGLAMAIESTNAENFESPVVPDSQQQLLSTNSVYLAILADLKTLPSNRNVGDGQ